MDEVAELRIAIGDYPHTERLKSGGIRTAKFRAAWLAFPAISRAFAPMVRDGAFDVCEMALATFLLARAFAKPLVLLPVALAARFQEAALICRADSPIASPQDLAGKRVGVRSYSQTTAVWLRGILAEDFGLAPAQTHWLTQEAAHVQEFIDPDFVERAGPGTDLLAMLRDGGLDAVIAGNDLQPDPAFRPVIAGLPFWHRHHFIPVNHVLTIRADIAAARPDLCAELVRLFAAAPYRLTSQGHECAAIGRAALQPSLDVMLRFMREQNFLPPDFDAATIWAGTPGEIG